MSILGAQRLTPEDALERVGGLLGETGGPATNADGVLKKPMGQAANVQGNQEEGGPVVKVTAANHNQVRRMPSLETNIKMKCEMRGKLR